MEERGVWGPFPSRVSIAQTLFQRITRRSLLFFFRRDSDILDCCGHSRVHLSRGWIDFYPSAELRDPRLTHVFIETEGAPGVPMEGIWEPRESRFRARSSNRRSLTVETGYLSLRLDTEPRTVAFEVLPACRMAGATES